MCTESGKFKESFQTFVLHESEESVVQLNSFGEGLVSGSAVPSSPLPTCRDAAREKSFEENWLEFRPCGVDGRGMCGRSGANNTDAGVRCGGGA